MTHKDYELLATVFREARIAAIRDQPAAMLDGIIDAQLRLERALEATYENFNRQRFIQACYTEAEANDDV